MKYAFVFAAIVAIWAAVLIIAAGTNTDVVLLDLAAVSLTLVLFIIGFRRGR